MQRSKPTSDSDRGQAYTLEGFVSAMVVLMALLFALQSVVIMPTTGGLADRTVKAQLEQETQDALLISATADESEGNLSKLVRYWNANEEEFHNASESGLDFYYNASNQTEFHDEFVLGELLHDRFTERGPSYNVELVYQDQAGEFEENGTYLVHQSEGEAVVASYTVTLFESDNLTAPGSEDIRLRDAHECDGGSYADGCYPIPPAHDDETASEIYNIVEVRVEVW